MYNGKLFYTNHTGIRFAVSDDFDNVIELKEDVEECNNAREFLAVAISHNKYTENAVIAKDNAKMTRLVFKDVYGNEHYLIAYKES